MPDDFFIFYNLGYKYAENLSADKRCKHNQGNAYFNYLFVHNQDSFLFKNTV